MLAHHAIGGGASGADQASRRRRCPVCARRTPDSALSRCVGCGTVALHPCLDVLFAIMPVRPGRRVLQGCDEHVLVQAVFTEYELAGV